MRWVDAGTPAGWEPWQFVTRQGAERARDMHMQGATVEPVLQIEMPAPFPEPSAALTRLLAELEQLPIGFSGF